MNEAIFLFDVGTFQGGPAGLLEYWFVSMEDTENDDEAQDRLRAYHLNMTFEDFFERRDKLRGQGRELVELFATGIGGE